MKKTNNKIGFTLVEMICVIAIIVILAAVLLIGLGDKLNEWKIQLSTIGSKHNSDIDYVINNIDSSSDGESINYDSIHNLYGDGDDLSLNHDTRTPEEIAHDEVVTNLDSLFTTNLRQGDLSTLGKLIVSNKPAEINQMLQNNGIDNAYAFVSNDSNINNYATTVLANNGINASVSYTKIVSVTTDGTVLSDCNRNDSVQVIQYLYYETKINGVKYAVLYGYREVTATVTSTNRNGSISYDTSDTDGSTWTLVE